jgi:uncharacterized protein (TIGR02466 family)
MADRFSITYSVTDKASGKEAGAAPAREAVTPAAAAATLPSFDLFPTRVWQARLDALTEYFPQWVQLVLAMRAATPKPAGRTVRQGWNSVDMSVLERAELASLRQVIRAACTAALAEMGAADRPFQLQSWINLHDRGGFNFLHMHELSLLSGSFYLQVPPGSGDFVFRDPRPGVLHGWVKGGVPNGHGDVHLAPSTGLLVLFPCWLEHYVEPHEADEPRITIAFNANATQRADQPD